MCTQYNSKPSSFSQHTVLVVFLDNKTEIVTAPHALTQITCNKLTRAKH